MKIVLDYNFVRAALFAATLSFAVLSLVGVHPMLTLVHIHALDGDPIGGSQP